LFMIVPWQVVVLSSDRTDHRGLVGVRVLTFRRHHIADRR
jgi:hypothetical protein